MAEDLGPPGEADQIIMLKRAAMSLKFHPRLEGDDIVLVALPDEEYEIAILNVCGVKIPCHAAILP